MKASALQYNKTKFLVFWTLITLLLLSFFVYIFFVNSAIVNIVDRKVLSSEHKNITAHISELESEYFQLQSKITPEYAKDLGFIESDDTMFAVRGSYSGLAQLNQ